MDALKTPPAGTLGPTGEKKSPIRRLGRGLSSLIGPATPVQIEVPVGDSAQVLSSQAVTNGSGRPHVTGSALTEFQSIAVSEIVPSRFQPRKEMDEASIGRLAESIKRSGLMQPIVVRPLKGGGGARYELVAGERRWRAAKSAGLERIPALVRELIDEQAAEWALVENVQREDLNAMERAWALRSLAEKFSLQQQELAERVGLERPTVANLLRLTELEPEIAALISKGHLSAGHGKALLAAPAGDARIALAKSAAVLELSVRALEAKARELASPGNGAPRTREQAESAGRLAVLRDLERQIGQQLGTKVQIGTDRKGKKGRLSIEFYGLDHFEGLLARLNIKTQ